MHSVLRDRYATANFYLTLGSLIPTAALLCLALVSDQFAQSAMGLTPDHFKIFNAAVALFAFLCILIQLVWKPDSRSDAHARAVDHYANAKYDAKHLLDSPEALEPMTVRIVEEKYLDQRGLPPIPDAKFNWLKQRHLRKVDLSRRLDENPWMRLPRWPWERPKTDTAEKHVAGALPAETGLGESGK